MPPPTLKMNYATCVRRDRFVCRRSFSITSGSFQFTTELFASLMHNFNHIQRDLRDLNFNFAFEEKIDD